jgi:Cu(I)/Ag(I) efflux system membrane fusion protein/cobalt-zinc-cadmium efflux system membrane fusion protein
MKAPVSPEVSLGVRALKALLLLVASFVLFYLLFFDPWGLHPIDGWLQARLGYHTGAVKMTSGESEEQLWTCPMHPHILEDEPGACPVCGMALVPVTGSGSTSGAGEAPSRRGEREILFYRNPMNPTITSPVPAKDEMGMDYVPVYSDEVDEAAAQGTTVRIDPVVVQNMNVQTAMVERRDLVQEIRTVGYLEYDQEHMVTVTTKYAGWVEKVYVNYVGEPVKKGQPLFEIYSPELVQTEQELLSAIDYAKKFDAAATGAGRRARALVDSARERLRYWDISPEQIDNLESTGEVFRTLQVVAPASGLVMKRIAGLEGMAVQPGMEVYHIADLRSLWLAVEVFEHQVAQIGVGTEAEIELTYLPGEVFRGTVRFIEPEFSEATRTLQMKIEVPNNDGRLRSGMFGTVRFHPTAARQALVVPTQAILRTGQRNVVIVDLGDGSFAPREVQTGHEGGGYAEVISGLEEHDRIVTSSQFLIDSESNLQEAVQKMIAQRSGHEGH